MPISTLYGGYFQKSKSFLFPSLGIRKSEQTVDIMTFICWENVYTIKEHRLMVVKFGGIDNAEYRRFEKVHLLANAFFEDITYVDKNTIVYVFNLEPFRQDWELFLTGRYSMLSPKLKKCIRNYWQSSTPEWDYMETFLYPDRFWNVYIELLYEYKDQRSGLELLRSVGELCDPYHSSRELFKVVNKSLQTTMPVF